ncbi:MAG: ATP-binding cassette domain-containing protein [Gracilibacteraceae bacterium]|jgi:tungstate transport system ATP-binding protein|nr:ATP-binding cassette domain-containing protein [Gracilibacteraceae bacterium]
MIKLVQVEKYFRGRPALSIAAYTFERGGRYALMGPNGSGKSTLLRLLAGVLRPDAGEIRVEGLAADAIGYMPQFPYIFGFSVLKNVLIALPAGGAERRTARAAALQALERLEIGHLAARPGGTLSGGEKQRLALARMLVRPRQLLLLDEPTSSLDRAGTLLAEQVLAECARQGCALVMASHDQGQAQRLARTVLLFESGRLAGEDQF